MRFRKRVKIAKGISLNFSSSGTSLTLGGRGASVNIGKKGTYLNTGIPALGLYDRTKISGTTKRKSNYSKNNFNSNSTQKFDFSYNLDLDDKGKPVLRDSVGRLITNESIIRKIKSTQQYKNLLSYKQKVKQQEVEESTLNFINIYKLAPKIVNETTIIKELNNLKLKKYKKNIFDEEAPKLNEIKSQLIQTSKQKIKSILFWNNKSKREKYVKDNLNEEYQKALANFEYQKKKFNDEENEKEKSKNIDFLNIYNYEKSILERFLNADSNAIENEIIEILENITLPADFSVDFDYNSGNKTLSIDLDLPEIEDIPTSKVNYLASGAISIKEKTQKELKYDYATCTIGMAFFFASTFFNVTKNIDSIIISGYTQRVNKKNGKTEDEYVYSIEFERKILEDINVQDIEPIEAITNFKHKINLLANYDLKTIEPF